MYVKYLKYLNREYQEHHASFKRLIYKVTSQEYLNSSPLTTSVLLYDLE